MRHRRRGNINTLAHSLVWLGSRHALALLFLAAVLLITVSRTNQADVEALRVRATSSLAPLWAALAAPGETAGRMSAEISSWQNVRTENKRLLTDNAALIEWREEAARLATENAKLKEMLNYTAPPAARAVTARVVADPGSTYQRSVLVLSGFEDGIEAGAAVLGKVGVVGRVIEVGPKAARILLLTDVNARIPAHLERTGSNAMLSGTGETQPELLYVPRDASPEIGERVVTSGHGGIFPAGLPIGTVATNVNGRITVAPLESASSLDVVRLIDYRAPDDVAPAKNSAANTPTTPAKTKR